MTRAYCSRWHTVQTPFGAQSMLHTKPLYLFDVSPDLIRFMAGFSKLIKPIPADRDTRTIAPTVFRQGRARIIRKMERKKWGPSASGPVERRAHALDTGASGRSCGGAEELFGKLTRPTNDFSGSLRLRARMCRHDLHAKPARAN
jgi:hypothetical protein